MRASLCGNCAHSVLEGIVPCGVIPVSSFVCKVIKSTEELPEVSLKNEHPHACLLLFGLPSRPRCSRDKGPAHGDANDVAIVDGMHTQCWLVENMLN